MKTSLVPLLLTAILLFSCGPKKPTGLSSRSFYYWQTRCDNFNWRDSTYTGMKVDKIYLRLFDVGWNRDGKVPEPISPFVREYGGCSIADTLVPVVFISNEVFKNLDKKQSEELAADVHRKMLSLLVNFIPDAPGRPFDWGYWEQKPYQNKSDFREMAKYDSVIAKTFSFIHEVQFDCDWTKTTRENYFAFLRAAQKDMKQFRISSTVRLYQYKYPKEAGVPPVNRGMLMCYNAGDATDLKTANSIFDKKEIEKYLDASAYPLPLDYALPIFRWSLLYHDGKLVRILPSDFPLTFASHLTTTDTHHYIANDDFNSGDTSTAMLIRKGDEIRIEESDFNDVADVASRLSELRNNETARLTLFDLSNENLSNHKKEIEAIFNSF